ncbi:MAG: nucleotidyl transferase AbiEii/AbiGii toxin family protein [Eubacteriales bacterium]|nr:nucleotidyl transferase AbiEii/AbiGii toxin family protein [Eubacteriales bacterium]MDD4474349.1 nucleotidyl transferase AbiEii/AbiGii toxin family protein [Eubacteriales bacterium]
MNTIIEQMLKSYNTQNLYDKKNTMKEVMQEIVLCGLSRAGFFKKAAFYGGTALRVFHGLDRFSEDLDFSLVKVDEIFNIKEYFPTLEREVNAYGLNMTITEKEKTKETNIQSAFLKGNTKEHLLMFYSDSAIPGVAVNDAIKIKFEVDINPPDFATFEHKYRLLPVPYEIKLYDVPALFAGKIHAVICRAWQNRIKGRDLYDYIFYLSRKAAVNQKHLRERLLQSGFITNETVCSLDEIKEMLFKRFNSIDYEQAKSDVEPFIRDTSVLNVWSAEFFKQITNALTSK